MGKGGRNGGGRRDRGHQEDVGNDTGLERRPPHHELRDLIMLTRFKLAGFPSKHHEVPQKWKTEKGQCCSRV